MNAIRNFLRREDGPTAVEYGVVMGLVCVVVIAGLSLLGNKTNAEVTSSGNFLSAVTMTNNKLGAVLTAGPVPGTGWNMAGGGGNNPLITASGGTGPYTYTLVSQTIVDPNAKLILAAGSGAGNNTPWSSGNCYLSFGNPNYPTPGNYTVTLKAVDSLGVAGQVTWTIVVN